MEAVLFYILGAIAIITALAAITRVSPLSAGLWIIGCFVAVGGLFGLLDAPIVALFQILLAAGAVMVLIIFVIMLVRLDPGSFKGRGIRFSKVVGAFVAAYFAAVVVLVILKPPFAAAPPTESVDNAALDLGRLLMGEFAVPFELVSVLMVVAMIGVVALAKKRT